jgi:hypothetical protein
VRILSYIHLVYIGIWREIRRLRRRHLAFLNTTKSLRRKTVVKCVQEKMETAEPVSYEFSGHAVGAFAHRRPMDLTLSQNIPFYSHPTTASYSLPYQAPNGLPYNYGHPVGHAHSNPYQHYFVPSQHHPVHHQPLRLTTEPQPLQSLPQIRPAKNAISQPAKSPTDHDSGMQPTGAGHSSPDGTHETKPSPSDIAFSTNVDVLMKAIQAKHSSSPHQQSLPPLQHLAPASQVYPMTTYPVASPTPPRFYLGSEGQLSRSGKKRKYTCTLSGCGKSFAQKTHLDIHIRAHTGDKPFVSTHYRTSGCDRQLIEVDLADLQGALVRPTLLAARQPQGRHRPPQLES